MSRHRNIRWYGQEYLEGQRLRRPVDHCSNNVESYTPEDRIHQEKQTDELSSAKWLSNEDTASTSTCTRAEALEITEAFNRSYLCKFNRTAAEHLQCGGKAYTSPCLPNPYERSDTYDHDARVFTCPELTFCNDESGAADSIWSEQSHSRDTHVREPNTAMPNKFKVWTSPELLEWREVSQTPLCEHRDENAVDVDWYRSPVANVNTGGLSRHGEAKTCQVLPSMRSDCCVFEAKRPCPTTHPSTQQIGPPVAWFQAGGVEGQTENLEQSLWL